MTNIDYALIVGVVFLVAVVAVRIFVGRRRKAEQMPAPEIKVPKTASNAARVPENATVKPVDKVEAESAAAASVAPTAPATTPEKPMAKEKPASSEIRPSERERPAEKKPAPQYEEITDPLALIKTFSAPVEKRIEAIREAGLKKMAEAVPALIEALYEPDQSISLAATESLGQIGDPRAIEPLLEVSRRSDAALIKAIGHDTEKQQRVEAEKAQEEEANANPYKFKEMVVFKIDQLPVEYFQPDGTPLPRKELVVRGLKDNSQQMRQMAAKAAIGLDSEDVVEPLIEALANPFEVESVRFMAAEALGGMQNDKSVESLLRALKDENVAVRYSAAAALSGRKDERVLAALVEAVNDPDRFVKASVAYALGTTLEPEALKALFRCVTDENEVVRFSAAKAIAAFPYDEVFAQLDAMSGRNSREAKMVRVEVLGQMKDERSIKALKELLSDSDSEVSYKASIALMGNENVEVLEELIAVSRRLDDELKQIASRNSQIGNPKVKASETAAPEKISTGQVKKLEEIGSLPPNLEKLRRSLLDSSPNIRGSAANALGDFQQPEAVALLSAAARDENEFVRASAVNSLGRIGSAEALDFVIVYEKDASEEVRYAVVKALSSSNSEIARDCLGRMAKNDRSKNVKRAARLALEKLNT